MSNDELASNDEIKEYKEEGEEDRLGSENLHSKLAQNLIDQVRAFNAIKVPIPSSHHHHHPHHRANPLAAYHHLSSSLDTAHHHHHYLHPPPPAHMHKWIGLDLDGGQYPPPPLSHLPFSQWYPPTPSGMYPTSPFYSPPHYLNFTTHPLPSPLSHSLFYSPPPPPPPPTTPQFNHHHHSHHHHPNTSIPPPSSTSSTSSSSSTSSTSSILSLSSTPHQQEQHQSTGQQDQHANNNPNSMLNFSHIKKPLNAFMLYMKENRAIVAAQSTRKESATINQILGKNWHLLSQDEQNKYYKKAESARAAHREQYPCWTAKDNYANNKKKKKTKREKTAEGEGSLKKCRARFGLDQQASWCKPCRRKKKCTRFSDEKTINSI